MSKDEVELRLAYLHGKKEILEVLTRGKLFKTPWHGELKATQSEMQCLEKAWDVFQ